MKFSILISASLLFITTSPLVAQTVAAQGKDQVKTLWGEIETGLQYDSNILQTKNNEESDVIWESIISLAYRPDEVKWSGRAVFNQYQENDELDYSFFEIGGERPFGTQDYGSLFFNLSPTAPLDKQDPTRDPFELGSYGVSASFDRDTASLGNIGLALAYTKLDYESPFDAKDTDIISLGPSLFYRINDFWTFYSEYTYEWGDARTGTIPGGFRDDISYQAHALSLKIIHPLSTKTRIRLRYRIRKKRFTTGSDDTFHADREDTNHSLYGELQHSPIKHLLLISRAEYRLRDSTDTFVEFDENRFTFSIAYQF